MGAKEDYDRATERLAVVDQLRLRYCWLLGQQRHDEAELVYQQYRQYYRATDPSNQELS